MCRPPSLFEPVQPQTIAEFQIQGSVNECQIKVSLVLNALIQLRPFMQPMQELTIQTILLPQKILNQIGRVIKNELFGLVIVVRNSVLT